MHSVRRRDLLIALLLGLLAFLAAALTDTHYGITYDEPPNASLGRLSADWFGELARHPAAALSRESLSHYWSAAVDEQPPLTKTFSGICQVLASPLVGDLTAMRLAPNALFGLGVALLFFFTAGLAGRAAGVVAALGYLLLPRTFADSHYVVHDVAIATMTLAVMAAAHRSAVTGSRRWAAATGALFGVALLTKLNAFFIPAIVIGWQVLFCRRNLGWNALALALLGPAVFIIGWPWLWPDIPGRMVGYALFHMKHYPVDTFYLGQTWHYAPWHYPAVMTTLTTPPAVLALGLAGVAAAARRWRAQPGLLLPVVGLAVSLGASSMPFAPKYDGVRLFTPAFICLATLWGVGFAAAGGRLAAFLAKRLPGGALFGKPAGPIVIGGLAAAVLLPSLNGILATHPYELAYYNSLAGGQAGARRLGLETIYWGGGYLAAVPYLNNLPPGSRVYVTPRGCVSLLELYQQAGALRPDLQWVAPATADPAAAAGCRAVLFQCAQGEMDAVSWGLYRSGRPPEWQLDLHGVPLMQAYHGAEVPAILGP